MTKYKMNNDSGSTTGSQITLTSYMVGENLEMDQDIIKGVTTILDLPQEKYTHRKLTKAFKVKPNAGKWQRLKERARRSCTKKLLYNRVPILSWLPNYNLNCALCHLMAGITVGLTVIPQERAYSNVVGLPPQIDAPWKKPKKGKAPRRK